DQPSVAKGSPKPGDAGGEAKGAPKGGGQPQADAARAEAKSGGPEKAGEQGVARGEAKDDPKKRSLASELKRWEGDLRAGDGRQSAEAEKKVEGLARNAGDKEVRDLAQKILDDGRKDRASAPGLPKAPPRDDPKDGPTCDYKGGGGKDAGAAKGGKEDG